MTETFPAAWEYITWHDLRGRLMTVTIQGPQAGPSGTKMTMERDPRSSPGIPGAQELKALYQTGYQMAARK